MRLPSKRFYNNIFAFTLFVYGREIDLSSGIVDEKFINSAITRYRASVDGNNNVAFGNVYARHRKW